MSSPPSEAAVETFDEAILHRPTVSLHLPAPHADEQRPRCHRKEQSRPRALRQQHADDPAGADQCRHHDQRERTGHVGNSASNGCLRWR
jgi:hypothetical protein